MAPKRKYTQLETPQKNRIIGAAKFCEAQGIEYSKTAIASTFNTTRDKVDYALQSECDRTGRRSELKAWNNKKLSERDLDRVELFLVQNGFDSHELTWDEIADQFGFEVIGQTLRRNMAQRGVYSFIAASKLYINPKLAVLRVKWAAIMLKQHPRPEDWRLVRFSDEVHFG